MNPLAERFKKQVVMNEQLNLLITLQEIDSTIVQKKNRIDSIPDEIRHYTEPLNQAKISFKKEQNRYNSVEKNKRQKEIQLQEISDRIEKLKARVSEIKSNKEYQAHLKEIEQVEKEKYLLEDDILYLMEELDEASTSLSDSEKKIEDAKNTLQSIQKELDTKKAALEKELLELKDKRTSLANKIHKEFYDSYMYTLQKTNGLAVVEAKDEVCLGCYMNIPPQFYVEITTSDEIYKCPQCGRFLYRKD